jgi:L-fuconolactonase
VTAGPGSPADDQALRPPRIDAHQHFWRYDQREYGWIDERMGRLRRDFLPGELKGELDHVGFDGCVAVQTCPSLAETRWLLELADRHPFILGVVGWVDLQSPAAREELQDVASHPKLVGVRHGVQDEPDESFLLRPEFGRGIALLESFGLAYDILIYPRHLRVATDFVRRFPGVRFALDHVAKPEIRNGEIRDWARDLRALASLPNVVCKLSGLVTEADWDRWTPEDLEPCLEVAFDGFGPERLLIGSDWPVCTLAADYARTLGVVMDYLAPRPEAEGDAVLGLNALRFWRLARQEGRT